MIVRDRPCLCAGVIYFFRALFYPRRNTQRLQITGISSVSCKRRKRVPYSNSFLRHIYYHCLDMLKCQVACSTRPEIIARVSASFTVNFVQRRLSFAVPAAASSLAAVPVLSRSSRDKHKDDVVACHEPKAPARALFVFCA